MENYFMKGNIYIIKNIMEKYLMNMKMLYMK